MNFLLNFILAEKQKSTAKFSDFLYKGSCPACINFMRHDEYYFKWIVSQS